MATQALLELRRDQLDPQRICRTLVAALSDPDEGVRRCGLEAAALLAHKVGMGQLPALLRAAHASEAQLSMVLQRAAEAQLPCLGPDGLVQHVWEQQEGGGVPGGYNPSAYTGSDAGSPSPSPSPTAADPHMLLRGQSAANVLTLAGSGGSGSSVTAPLRTAISAMESPVGSPAPSRRVPSD